jgi:hypothetical protein
VIRGGVRVEVPVVLLHPGDVVGRGPLDLFLGRILIAQPDQALRLVQVHRLLDVRRFPGGASGAGLLAGTEPGKDAHETSVPRQRPGALAMAP